MSFNPFTLKPHTFITPFGLIKLHLYNLEYIYTILQYYYKCIYNIICNCIYIIYTHHIIIYNDIHFLHSSVEGHLSCLHSLAIVNNAAIIIAVQVSLLYPDSCSFGYVSRSSISNINRPCGSSIFGFLRNLHTTFHNACTNLHSHQQSLRVPVSLHPHHHLFLFLLLKMAIPTGVRWNLSVVLICIHFMDRVVEHFLMYSLAICTSSFEIPCSIHVPKFFIGMLILWGLRFWAPYRFRTLAPYWKMNSWEIFLLFCRQSLKPSDYNFCCAKDF
jgi:hypothetical protein